MLDPYSPDSISDPASLWARLREEAPVFEVPGSDGHFLISRYADVRGVCEKVEVLSNELLASVQHGADGRPRLLSAPSKDSPHGRVMGAADGEIRLVSDAVAAGTLEMWEASGLLFQLVVAGSDTTVSLI